VTPRPCTCCGDSHAYTAEECVNFLTFGQGGADFAESQRLARLYDEEASAPCREGASDETGR
jgi:hypothetical protein